MNSVGRELALLAKLHAHAPTRSMLRFAWWSYVAMPFMRLTRTAPGIENVRRLVFICSGNICRSPYAELRVRTMGFPAVSFGLDAGVSDPPPAEAITAAAERGIDISGHRSRPADAVQITTTDLLLLMEPGMRRPVIAQTQSLAPVAELGMWSGHFFRHPYLPDPFGLPVDTFRIVYDLIDDALVELMSLLERRPMSPRT